jgi:hypothetical protein
MNPLNQRKHYTQMSTAERDAVLTFVRSIHNWDIYRNPHLIERMAEKNISADDIICVLRNGDIIEAHANNFPDIRFVLRGNVGSKDVCVCGTKRGTVVTAWANRPFDRHRTLDKSQYQWKADLTSVFNARKGN